MLRSRIYHGEQELISTLTPEQFFALLSHDYDTGFAAGKASAQKEILCMLAADGMPAEKIALLLQMNIFIWVFKAYIAIYLVTNTFNITMAVFDVGQHVVNGAAGVISGNTEIDATTAITNLLDTMEDMEVGELFLLALETMLISMTMKILSVAITVILYGRMIEIYLTCSVAPIPFATMTNKEWGNIGNNYLKGLFALAFQGFFMMVCVGIYAVIVQSMTISSNIHGAMFSIAAYTIVLAYSLFKTASLSKSIFNAH